MSRLSDFDGKKIFDLGCSNGTVSYFLKKNGGQWTHADLDLANVITAKKILGENVLQFSEGRLPFGDKQFDMVIALDVLEHLDDDVAMVREIRRVLKPNGTVIVSTPISGGTFILNRLKEKMGLTPEIYGHKREGYSLAQLSELLEDNGFDVSHASTYSKFFVEFFEVLLNIGYTKINRVKASELRSGAISPSSEDDIKKFNLLFFIYSKIVYPFIYGITRLDKFLGFKTGYATMVKAERMEVQ